MDELAFLHAPPALEAGRHILYVYRSGYFRRAVRMRAAGLALARGWWTEATPTLERLGVELLVARFETTLLVCHVAPSRGGRPPREDALDALLRPLDGPGTHSAFLCLPETSPLLGRPLWAEIAAQALVIEEPPVTAGTVEALLDGLMLWAPWYDFARLRGRGALAAALAERCLQEDWTLPQLVQAFQATALTGIDFTRDRLVGDPAEAGEDVAPARALTLPLVRFLAGLDEGALAQLVRLIDDRCHRQGRRPDEIVAALHRSAATLLRRHAVPSPQGRRAAQDTPYGPLLAWCALLLIHEDEARLNPPLFVDLLGRRCRALARGRSSADEGPSWAAMAARLTRADTGERAALRAARERLHAALRAALQARDPTQDDRFAAAVRAVVDRTWAAREAADALNEAPDGLGDEVADEDGDDPAGAAASPAKPPDPAPGGGAVLAYASCADVPGSRGAVARIPILAGASTAPAVLIEGPPGSGRWAVTRLLARALQCEGEPGTDRPCRRCEACRRYNPTRDQPQYVACSAAAGLDEAGLRTFVDDGAQSLPFVRYSVLVIGEVEAAVGPLLDFTLKRLEAPARKVAFVFLTADRGRVRETIVSRCDVLTLERLDEADSLAFLARLDAGSDRPLGPDAAALIVAAAEGLAARLHRGHAAATGRPDAGALDILEAMDQGWGREAVADWGAVTSGRAPASAPESIARRTHRLRRVLLDLRLRGLESPPLPTLAVPALAHGAGDGWPGLVARLRAAARDLRTEPDALWSDLARRWSADIARESLGLSLACDGTRRVYGSDPADP